VAFVTEQLSKVSGVKDSETYVVLKNINHWISADRVSQLIGDISIPLTQQGGDKP
jgi:hypothetical protein